MYGLLTAGLSDKDFSHNHVGGQNRSRGEGITKWQIVYVPLDPVTDYVHILDLNIRLRVGWKTLPNLNFKLKVQTQISNSNLNFKTKIFPVLPGNPEFWEIESKGKRNERN